MHSTPSGEHRLRSQSSCPSSPLLVPPSGYMLEVQVSIINSLRTKLDGFDSWFCLLLVDNLSAFVSSAKKWEY